MKIIFRSSTDSDYLVRERMDIDGKEALYVGPLCECPEDAIIGRDLVSCTDVIAYMRRAFEAGKNGEDLIVENGEWEG